MPLDFPASPVDGQAYDNWIYSSSKGAWLAKPLEPMAAVPSPTAPLNPTNGDMWYNTNDGTTYVYYNDGSTAQWVEMTAPISANGYYSPNYIINGAFDIWQRGTSFASPSYTADRWYTGTGNWTRSTDVPASTGITYSLANSASQTNWTIQQAIELPIQGSANGFNNGVYTLSFYAKIDSGKTFAVAAWYADGVAGGNQGAAMLYNPSLVGTGSWERYTVTENLSSYTANATNKAFRIGIFNLASIAFTTVAVTGFQLEQGSTATPFRRNANSLQGELAACQRYYYRITSTDINSFFGLGFVTGATNFSAIIPFPVNMRIKPIITVPAASLFEVRTSTPIAPTAIIGATTTTTSYLGVVDVTLSGATAGQSGVLRSSDTGATSAYIDFSAEL